MGGIHIAHNAAAMGKVPEHLTKQGKSEGFSLFTSQ
jgi:hypothetical protein